MKALLVLFLSLGILGARAISLPDGPEAGQKAPSLTLDTWFQAPPEAAQGWPAGKVVVLEFWEIGCAPCVAAIPHLNELADQFKGKPVQFIAVSDDSESAVRSFLKKKPIHAWIGLGAAAGSNDANPYRVCGFPHTILIDSEGRIALITDPSRLNAKQIQACLDGLLGRPPARNDYWTSEGGAIPGLIPGQYRMGIRPLFQVMVQPTQTNSTHVEAWIEHQAMTLQKERLSRALEIAYHVEYARILKETPLPSDNYDFFIRLPPVNGHPPSQSAFEAVVSQAIATAFGLSVNRELRNVDVLVLRTNASSLVRLPQSTNTSGAYMASFSPGEAAAADKPLSVLTDELETVTGLPVLDETGLTNHFSFDLTWEQKSAAPPNIPGITTALKNLGLELVLAKKEVSVVVVSQLARKG